MLVARRAIPAAVLAVAAIGAALALVSRQGATSLASSPPADAAQAGVDNAVRPADVKGYPGRARVCAAVGKGCTPLTTKPVAIGKVIDARAGGVSLETRRADGSAARVTVAGAYFKLEQGRAVDDVLVARLAGGAFKANCGVGTTGARPTSVVRRFVADGDGAFRVIGRYAQVTTTQSFASSLADRCDATVVRVARGSVQLDDLAVSVTRTLGPGATYRAKPPELHSNPGVTTAALPVSIPGFRGPVKVCAGVGRGCRALTAETLVPIGAVLDLRKGAVSLETAVVAGVTHRMTLSDGRVRLKQSSDPGALLTAVLVGGDFASTCRRRAQRSTPRTPILRPVHTGPRNVRRTKFTGSGPIESDGKHGNAIAPGTSFEMADQCLGMYVKVYSGAVRVRDVRRHHTTRVRAPGSILIRAPK
jgi:hypothetical protein